jgi:hypothetical protein
MTLADPECELGRLLEGARRRVTAALTGLPAYGLHADRAYATQTYSQGARGNEHFTQKEQ